MIGEQVLTHFAILLVILALAIYVARRNGLHRYFAVMAGVWVIIVDRYVKRMTVANLALGESAPLLPGFLALERVHNYGAAWSSFSGMRWLLVAVTTLGIGVLIFLVTRYVRHPLGVWSLWLVAAGGVGNLIDRVRLGYVVDMLRFEFINFPVFNVADIFVTCGALAAAVYYIKYYEACDAKKETDHG